MAKRKRQKNTRARTTSPQGAEFNSLQQTVKKNRFSLVLGIVIILIIGALVWSFTSKSSSQNGQSITNKIAQLFKGNKETSQTEAVKSYKVRAGDTLWGIAETTYGSGYNSVDIMHANKLSNPDAIEINQTLVLPSVSPRAPTRGEIAQAQTSQVTYTANTYTVKGGDCLWTIAQQVYGDPYQWTKIAQANNLTNPNLIYPNSHLSIPK